MTNVTILGVFRTHAQKEYGKVLEMKSTYIHNILALLFFFKLAMHLLKVWSKRHPVQRRKMRGRSRKCTFTRYCKWGIALKRILLPTMHILLPNYTNFRKFGVCNHVN